MADLGGRQGNTMGATGMAGSAYAEAVRATDCTNSDCMTRTEGTTGAQATQAAANLAGVQQGENDEQQPSAGRTTTVKTCQASTRMASHLSAGLR